MEDFRAGLSTPAILKLPQEILYMIFSCLASEESWRGTGMESLDTADDTTSSLRNVSITCKTLRYAVEATLYSGIAMAERLPRKEGDVYAPDDFVRLQRIIRTVIADPRLASLIKVIYVRPRKGHWSGCNTNAALYKQHFTRLLPLLPLRAGDEADFSSKLETSDGDAELGLLLCLARNLSHLKLQTLYVITGQEAWYRLLCGLDLMQQDIGTSLTKGTFDHLKYLTITPDGDRRDASTVRLDILSRMLVLPNLESLVACIKVFMEPGRPVAKSCIRNVELYGCQMLETSDQENVFAAFMRGFIGLKSIKVKAIEHTATDGFPDDVFLGVSEWHKIVHGLSPHHDHLTSLTLMAGGIEIVSAAELAPIPLLSSFSWLVDLHLDLRLLMGYGHRDFWGAYSPPSKTRLSDSLPESIEKLFLCFCNPFVLYGGILRPLLDAKLRHGRLHNLLELTTTMEKPRAVYHTHKFPFAVRAGTIAGRIMSYPPDQPGWMEDLISQPVDDQAGSYNISHMAGVYPDAPSRGFFDPFNLMPSCYHAIPPEHDRLVQGFAKVGVWWIFDHDVARLWPSEEEIFNDWGWRSYSV